MKVRCHNFALKNRTSTNLQENNKTTGVYLQLDGSVGYKLKNSQNLDLTLRYRGRSVYNSDATDEKRIRQQYDKKFDLGSADFKVRGRLEQRFMETFSWRNRLNVDFTIPLIHSAVVANNLSFYAKTEALWSMTPHKNPSFDQRTGIGLTKPISKDFSIDTEVQYRYKDYTDSPNDEIRISLILNLSK